MTTPEDAERLLRAIWDNLEGDFPLLRRDLPEEVRCGLSNDQVRGAVVSDYQICSEDGDECPCFDYLSTLRNLHELMGLPAPEREY